MHKKEKKAENNLIKLFRHKAKKKNKSHKNRTQDREKANLFQRRREQERDLQEGQDPSGVLLQLLQLCSSLLPRWIVHLFC